MKPLEVIKQFDQFLSERQEYFSAVVIGGAALAILGVVARETRDCDILDPEIPDSISNAAVNFAEQMTEKGYVLREDWLNNGPQSLKRNLPTGWQARLSPLFKGKSLSLQTLGRSDLLKTKLFAFCDRGFDRQDCLALRPTREELLECLPWVQKQDANVDWPKHVAVTIATLAKELGYEL